MTDPRIEAAILAYDREPLINPGCTQRAGVMAAIQAYLAHPLTKAEASEWATIETAPRDGENILLFAITDMGEDGTIRNWKMATGWWSGPNPGGNWNWEGRWLQPWETCPTHWMPLPEPPESG